MSGAETVVLEQPIEWAGVKITTIILQPITGRHMRAMPVDRTQMTVGTFMDLASRVSGVNAGALDLLSGGDLQKVIDAVARQMTPTQAATGAANS